MDKNIPPQKLELLEYFIETEYFERGTALEGIVKKLIGEKSIVNFSPKQKVFMRKK